jgi:hypothetical protein
VFLTYYNIFGRFLLNVLRSRAANLGEVFSALLRAKLSLALVEYELTGLQVQVTLRLTASQ